MDSVTPDGITLEELAQLRARGDVRLLDLRDAAAYERGHIPGSVSIPASELDGRIHELPPRPRLLVAVAESAEEARRQAERLRERGWLRCVPLLGPATAGEGPRETGPSRGALWEPTPIVRAWAERMPAGPVCDLGCGSGRNAVHLALRGHAVTAVDHLPDALAMALSLAARHGVAIRTCHLDLRRALPPPAPAPGYAAVLMIRFLQRELFSWIADALRPGGLFLLETYLAGAPEPGPDAARGTTPASAPARRLRPHEALDAFTADGGAAARWGILEHREEPDESGEAVARLVARREG